MSTLVTLAAAPDAVAPVLASVLALAAFLVGVPVFITDMRPQQKKQKLPQGTVLSDSNQPLEDQVGV